MSSSPPCDETTTCGAPDTCCLRPVLVSTRQMRPVFSVTSAWFVPGRNAIAHGESKLTTGVATNGRPDALPACAWVGPELPQAASTRNAACIRRGIIQAVSFLASEPSGRLRPLTQDSHASLQLTLTGDGGSAERRPPRGREGRRPACLRRQA